MANGTDSSSCLNSVSTLNTNFLRSKANIPGLIGVAAFYALVFLVGIFATWRGKRIKKRNQQQSAKEDVILAGRNIGGFVGLMTLTATAIGGGYINGTSEYIFNPKYGLAWCQAPFFYTIGIILNGVFFAKPMRRAGYMTLLDPFQQKFGRVQTAFLYIPSMLGSILWAGTILASLGTTLSVIIGLSYLWAVIISAVLAIIYTVIGGMYSVSYTDVIQLGCIFVGLWLALPFAMMHEATTSILETAKSEHSWLGAPITGTSIGVFIDFALLLIFGGMPWQEYFQRALAVKTDRQAMVLSIVSAFLIWFFMIPPVLIGAVAASTDWNATGYRDFGEIPIPACDYPLALPMVMRFLTPLPVGIIGLGAVSAAVMSSTDSAVLATSSMFAVNIYTPLRNAITSYCCKGASPVSDKETVWVMRVAMVCVGTVATIVAITATSIYGLYVLVGDLVYVLLFPQLVSVVYFPIANTYGSIFGYWVSLFFRLAGGEPFLNIPALIKYPYFDEENGTQVFPFRTLCMLIGLTSIPFVSWLASLCVRRFPTCKNIDSKLFQSFMTKEPDDWTYIEGKGIKEESKDTNIPLQPVGEKKQLNELPERQQLMANKVD